MKRYNIWIKILILSSISSVQAQHIDKLSMVRHSLPHVEHGGIYFVDFNNDNKKDILIFGLSMDYPYQPILEIHLATKPLTYSKIETLDFPGIYLGDAIINDLDKDGDLDVIISGIDNANTFKTSVFIQTEYNAEFKPIESTIKPSVRGNIESINLNGDNLPDLLVNGEQMYKDIQLKAYINKGNGMFVPIELNEDIKGSVSGDLKVLDINKDGREDILLTGWNGETNISELYINKVDYWNVEHLPVASRFSSVDIDYSEYTQYLNIVSTGKTTLNQSKTHIWALRQDNKAEKNLVDPIEDTPQLEMIDQTIYIFNIKSEDLNTPNVYDVLGRNRTPEVNIINSNKIHTHALPKGGYILKYSNFSLPFVVD